MVDLFQVEAGVSAVRLNGEMRRIERLPRRSWDDSAEVIAGTLTDILKTPAGSMALRPVQAVALYEIGTVGGLFGPLRVGSGKTLISFLAPEVAFCIRPLLLVPASLVRKTRRDEAELRRHWLLPGFMRIMSYEWLGQEQAADALEEYAPDIIIADEAHKLKNIRDASCARRVRRYMNDHPSTKFVGMSGTITKRSINDYAHLLMWAIPPTDAPLPRDYNDLELWADALDEKRTHHRTDPGALRVLCNETEGAMWDTDPRRAARLAYRRRLIDTPGVVASKHSPIKAKLSIRDVEPKISKAIDEAFTTLRKKWRTPDDWPIDDGLTMARHARELALGFYYVWDPRPPKYWLEARTDWFAYVRRVLRYSRTIDTELQVRKREAALEEGDGFDLLSDWLDVKDDYEQNTVARWIDDSVIDFCADWLHRNDNGIVWVEHQCFGDRLEQVSGRPYFGGGGLSKAGVAIEDASGGVIASIKSNSTGRNLQHKWHRNLISSMPSDGALVEQLIGRTHRDGQRADEVPFDVLVSCAEHVGAFHQAVRDCRFVFDTTGSPQKLLIARTDVVDVDTIAFRSGIRWDKELHGQ